MIKLFCTILCFIFSFVAIAQQQAPVTAEDFFNAAAEKYINKQTTEALKLIDAGFKVEPNNEKLQKLAELILKENKNKQQQQQQKQQQQKQQQNNEQQKQQQNKQQQNNEQKEQQSQSGKMNKEDAERMLDAMRQKELQIQNKLNQPHPQQRTTIEKDW